MPTLQRPKQKAIIMNLKKRIESWLSILLLKREIHTNTIKTYRFFLTENTPRLSCKDWSVNTFCGADGLYVAFTMIHRNISYMTTRTALHSKCIAWRQAMQRAPLYKSAVSRGPRILVQNITVNVTFLLALCKGSPGLAHASSLTNTLFVARRSFIR